MVVVWAMRHALGLVKFEAEGVFCERFLNLAAANGVCIRSPVKSGIVMRGSVLAKDYAKLRKPAKQAGVRLHMIKKTGIPFLVKKYSRRAGLAAGAAAFLIFLTVMSRFIWEVDISGCEKIPPEAVASTAENAGLRIGTAHGSHDVRKVESALLTNIDELAWVAVNLEGCVANISVKEYTPIPELFHDDDVPTNVIAARTGIIRRMEVYDGASMVKVGEAVPEGALLVSGVIEDAFKQLTLKHARAKIYAETEYEIKAYFPMRQVLKKRTGEVITHTTIDFFGAEIPLWMGGYNGAVERSTEVRRAYFLWLPLQIFIKKERIYPVKQINITYNREQAKGGARQILEEREAKELKDTEILSRKLYGDVDGETYVLTAEYKCVMDIAKEEPLLSEMPWENTDSWS